MSSQARRHRRNLEEENMATAVVYKGSVWDRKLQMLKVEWRF